ncbi:stalk domain-containing protein [Chengkuizengella marina]|uniref:Copper amine oxidase N-terminal domain-containing protein n=1 Tax=Chengkuizengella marina TaxID=2507566 RepID=A0A6N9PZB0_9BACL|nr:stalk domain-containing protein [Chengkuizengella marina]NBI28142.1 hypothetical protein [Chengkuizengella marina]
MRKRTMFSILFILSFLFSATAIASEETKIDVWIDGEQLQFEEEPFIDNNTTLVPFRVLFNDLGLKVKWDQETKTITGVNEELTVELTLNSNLAKVNGESLEMLVVPQLVNNRTFVPLRFVGESTGANVQWDGASKTISITSPEPKVNDEELIMELFDQYEAFYNDRDLEILSLFEKQIKEEWVEDSFENEFEYTSNQIEVKNLEILSIEDNEAYVYVEETYERIDGPFSLDYKYEIVYSLARHKNDKWLINDLEFTSFDYINLDELKNSDVDISEKDEKEIIATFEKYLDAFKEESYSKLKSTLHEDNVALSDSGWLEDFFKEFLFAEYDYTTVELEEAYVVYADGDEAVLYVSYSTESIYLETEEVDNESYEELVTFKKASNGKWKILSFNILDYNIEFE